VLAARCSPEQLAAVEESASRFDDALWSSLASSGLTSVVVPEADGGAGLGLAELCLLAEVAGRRCAAVPLVDTGVASLALAEAGAAAQLARVVAGAVLAVAPDLTGGLPSVTAAGAALTGSVAQVPWAPMAAAIVLPALDADGSLGLWLVETAAATLEPLVLTDHVPAADLVLDGAPALRLGGAAAVQALAHRLRLGLAAQLLGLADEGVRDAASYLSGREQFGRPLATFQATTQQLGDAYCDVQAVRATLEQAVWALDHAPAEVGRSVAAATWWAADASQRVQHAVQHLHGGIGADTTYPVHRRLLRTMSAVARLGGASRQLEPLARQLLPG
jgi:alkylation response protein AidB-like acyl-CoA dehydrogenase